MKAPMIDLSLLHPSATEGQNSAPASTTVADVGYPEDVAQPEQSGFFDNMLLPMAACVLVFWFIVIRPEKRQRKAREQMLNALKKGDEVLTSGGIHGRVAQVKGDVVTVQVADGVRLRFALSAVQNKTNEDEDEDEPEEQDEVDASDDSSQSD